MKLHEYQAKQLLRAAGVRVPKGVRLRSESCLAKLGQVRGPWVVKAQIHAGGRGKGSFLDGPLKGTGGVQIAKTEAQAATLARGMLGARLRTLQTGEEGQVVRNVWAEEASAIERELYLSLLLDRKQSKNIFIAAGEGGTDIETLAATRPEAVLKATLEPAMAGGGWSPCVARKLAGPLGLKGAQAKDFARLLQTLARFAEANDASLLEVNPLAVLADGSLAVLDAKVQIDDSALFRHPALARLEDKREIPPAERKASEHDLSYVQLDGDIGCMVNGAGLAMATMDIIALAGGRPANFLDVGGGASQEKVEAAFRIILSDKQVRAILVNIFGGIMRCDVIAEGVVAAARARGLKVPLVVRLEGTKAEEGRRILARSGLRIYPARGLAEAAERAVELAGGSGPKSGAKGKAKGRAKSGGKSAPKRAARSKRRAA